MRITQFLAVITLISLPLYVLRCKDFSWCSSPVPITLLEVLIMATFFSWAFWRLYSLRKGVISAQELVQRLRGALFLPLVAFLGVSTFAVFISPDFQAAAGIWKAYFIEPALLYIVVLDISTSRKSFSWILPPLLLSGLWVSSLAIWQWISQTNNFSPDYLVNKRESAVFDNPNALSLYLGPLILICFGMVFKIANQRNELMTKLFKLLAVVGIVAVYIGAVYLSRSRGAYIGLSLSALIFLAIILHRSLSDKLKRINIFAIFIAIAISMVVLVVGFININKVVNNASPKALDTGYTRLCIWQGTKKMVADHFITGVGLSGFPITYQKYATCEKQAFQYPHNIFLNFWVELGLIGLAVFLWISFVYLKILSKHLDDFMAIGFLAVLVYIFIHGLVDVPYFKNDLSAAFWVFLSVAVWFGNQKTKS